MTTRYVIVLLFSIVLLGSIPLQRLIRRILSSREIVLLEWFWFAALWGVLFNGYDLRRILGDEAGGTVWLLGPFVCACLAAHLSRFDQPPECTEGDRETA